MVRGMPVVPGGVRRRDRAGGLDGGIPGSCVDMTMIRRARIVGGFAVAGPSAFQRAERTPPALDITRALAPDLHAAAAADAVGGDAPSVMALLSHAVRIVAVPIEPAERVHFPRVAKIMEPDHAGRADARQPIGLDIGLRGRSLCETASRQARAGQRGGGNEKFSSLHGVLPRRSDARASRLQPGLEHRQVPDRITVVHRVTGALVGDEAVDEFRPDDAARFEVAQV